MGEISFSNHMRKLKEEVAEAETVKKCVEQAIQPTEQRKEKTKNRDIPNVFKDL